MIKNVIFDIGGVLITFDPTQALIDGGIEESRAKAIVGATIKSYLWQEMDRGFWPESLIIDTMVEEAPELEKDIRDFFAGKLIPLEGLIQEKKKTVEWMKELKEKGYNIYLLSNYPKCIFQTHWDKVYSFKDYVDGKIVSGYVGQMKSDPDIYKMLLEEYNLKPEECIFFDDRKENVITARLLGMQGMVFTDDVIGASLN